MVLIIATRVYAQEAAGSHLNNYCSAGSTAGYFMEHESVFGKIVKDEDNGGIDQKTRVCQVGGDTTQRGENGRHNFELMKVAHTHTSVEICRYDGI